ncbi:unnamed protein product [Lymnaea stagnalis]|uniref:Cerebral cavernous malformations 2 harmonin-homology domain-containing protein n=1 Tax=Lymnaea stagnalis TaxID=6523 RepID=A0AAV2HA97_LYMST
MDHDIRHKSNIFSLKSHADTGSSRRVDPTASGMYENKRRNLNNYDLKPPPYQSKHPNLIDDHVEKPVQYAGEIDGVSPHLDITNRTDVLKIIDKGKKQGSIPVHVSEDNIAILSLSVFNIKISKYNASDDLLLRIPMHEIAATCYIKDDKEHILAIKFGTPESCRLAVLYCESKPVAEEICALVGQCFNLVYTEALFRLLDNPLNPSDPIHHAASTISGNVAWLFLFPFLPNIFTVNYCNIKLSGYESGNSKTSDSGTGKELLEDYMNKLKAKLNADELRKFLQHLNDWKKENHFHQFCDEVLLLLGPDRKQLLSELIPFIPEHNYQYFEEFLKRNDIRMLDNTSTLSSSRNNLRFSTRRSFSEVSTTSSVSNNTASGDALDHLIDFAKAQFDSVDVDMDPKTYEPSKDY